MTTPLRLTEWTSCGGCAAKWGASLLSELVSELPGSFDKSLLVGLAPFDDAAVYKVTDDVALVSTTDFFPPLVDDPDDFGAIAAANACSDVFAMGANVVMAINIAAFPEHFPHEAITAIFASASKVVADAGGSIAGGHTIRNPEPIFGLAVQGVVHPDRVWRKGGAQPGDVVMMSKPVGTALALAGGCSTDKRAAINGMRVLNRRAADQLRVLGDDVHAVTDVTGYGLAGHGWEVAERGGVRLHIETGNIVAYPGALKAANEGLRTGGDPRNRAYVEGRAVIKAADGPAALCFDPQTSGGLLAAVPAAREAELASQGWWRAGYIETGATGIVLEA
jgi:selenide,water dikinase